ncbi:ATP-dependent DNA ligase [Streptomyces longispororuber]|uniref:DNA ligase (ATP) n=1 Tax=Streptomyces longispororuber TaxID=68230 RepID=A0A919DTC3_9ACTN|nr:non-homologous end-joining DNA ligase [Streptomyces longispororuber]GHE75716.1 ATP-dependent DNA ligase [Streptomyces longispororuber]
MAALPRIDPMLASTGPLPPPRAEHLWSAETKYDGQRAVVYLAGDGSVLLRSRSGADITAAYPEFAGLGDSVGAPAVLDGEIVVLDERGRPDFARLQPRMGLAASPGRAARLAAEAPAHLVLFDVMFLDGRLLTSLPYAERRPHLTRLVAPGPSWSVPSSVSGRSREALELTRSLGLEGILLKRLDSVYEPGVRSRAWVKVRNVRTVDAVVGGWLPGQGRLRGLPGAVLVGEVRDGALRYIGAVGTGWSERERAHLAELLAVAAQDTCPFTPPPPARGAEAHWVLPRLVAEISYSTRTRTGLLRQPVWHRLRPDLAPGDLDGEGPH